ncbi:hypothetical protein [Clostridium beijerinckii]|uniref:hypothetical protein n=1 Tax=Clostridium beijerinckii TaxID=1520 RepID=UPI001493ECE7|nr:hypothetical protein [Clostridium beijerinckii]NOW07868.1 hypothetical protein [Clostridium beijerinckii]NYC05426.1 hypothetical protein [Clostridium beijerinckii]NYC05499.1 hypothetical protein [Clostridium beijerinckii]
MKTLIVYDTEGNIIFAQSNANESCEIIIEDIPDGKQIKKVDTSISPNRPIFEDIPKSELELLKEQVNNLAQANAELTSIVAMGNTNA